MASDIRNANDEHLIGLVAAGSADAACDELFRRYRQKIYLWCYTYTHDADDAVELVQEIFIKVVDAAGGFAGASRFSTWLYRVTQNHCRNWVVSAGTRRRLAQVPVEDQELPDAGLLEEIRQLGIRDELERIIDEAEQVMKPDELDGFVLHYRDGRTVKEITKLLGCKNLTGARTLIQAARKKFRKLTDTGGGSDDAREH